MIVLFILCLIFPPLWPVLIIWALYSFVIAPLMLVAAAYAITRAEADAKARKAD